MKMFECYKTVDGQFFDNEEEAKRHEDDIVGAELEQFLRITMNLETRGCEVHKGMIKAINSRIALKETCRKILSVLQYEES